ncbi:hypothetical protein [Nannocystis pusilla]|uniref:hypothetical protein n=1 Tax=Nannocystis pusilla TaxID=889268 RepID=UPI003B79A6C5
MRAVFAASSRRTRRARGASPVSVRVFAVDGELRAGDVEASSEASQSTAWALSGWASRPSETDDIGNHIP